MVYYQMDKLVMMVGLGAASFFLISGGAGVALADNIVGNTDSITMNVGTTNSDLRIKVVATSSSGGDPVDGCNIGVKNDGIIAQVTLSIVPAEGLTVISDNPLIFDECGEKARQTVTLAATIGGTYEITAEAVDNDDENNGVYHYPIGATIVTVIDNVPPETTIISGPNNPTASQSAVFAFSSNEGGTFECSIDGGAFAACSSPTEYTGLAVGDHTFQVRATDLSGNTDQSPTSFSWTIKEVTITITLVSPSPAPWGELVTIEGTADVVDLTGLLVDVDWGDLSSTTGISIDITPGDTSGTWEATHTYQTAGTRTITATLVEGTTVKASATSQVVSEMHDTELVITCPEEGDQVTSDTKLLVCVSLIDVTAGVELSGQTVDISGASPHVTEGVTFTGNDLVLSACADPPCTIDPIGTDDNNPDNKVLYAGVGTEIKFPTNTPTALIYVQDTPVDIEFRVIENGGIQQDCGADPGLQDCVLPAPGPNDAGATYISATSGFSVVGGVTVFNGIEKIIITKVGGSTVDGTVGIAAVLTKNDDSSTSNLIEANFENEALGPKESPYTVDGGSAFAYEVTQSTEASNIPLDADYAGDGNYAPSSDSITYNVQVDPDPINGVGFVPVGESGAGSTTTGRSCTGSCSLDGDPIPDTEENQGFVDDSIIASGHKYFFPEAHDSSLIDIDWEIDAMYGVTPLTQAQADYIEDRALLEGLRVHIDIDETNICQAHGVINPVVAWTDAEAENTADLVVDTLNECDDWRSVTLNHFGTPNERTTAAGTGQGTGSGTLGSGNGELKLKRLVTRYLLMTYNTNNEGVTACGTTGIAVPGGMNAIASVQCLLDTATNEVSPAQIILGTAMHEMGHTYGLEHGGTGSINCMPNYKSVMNYMDQMPTTSMPVKAAGATTQYGWYGDYSHGRFLYQTGAGAPVGGDQNKIVENSLTDSNKLVMSGTWKEANGVKMSVGGDPSTLATVTQMKIVWSDTTPGAATNPKYGYAATTLASATSINWNGISGISNPYQDLNYLTVTVGNKQLPACTQSKDPTNLVSPQSDYLTIAQKVALSNNDAIDQLGLSLFGLGDPDHDPEMNLQTYETLNGVIFESPGVEPPLNNVGFGDPNLSKIKKGSTVNVKLDIFDDDGNMVTGSNLLSVYGIERIDLVIAKIVGGIPPDDADYFAPETSNPGSVRDRFAYDGSKWSYSYGTKNLVINADYAARIQLKFTTGEIYILDNKNDDVSDISFVFRIVKT